MIKYRVTIDYGGVECIEYFKTLSEVYELVEFNKKATRIEIEPEKDK